MRAIIIKTPGTKIRVRKGVVVVENDNGRIEVTPANCDVLIAVTARFTVTGMALRYLMRQGIDFVVMDKRGEPLGRFFPLVINKTIAARRAQYLAMFDGRGYRGVLKVIECKLRNQAAVLKYFAKSRRSEILREEAYIIERITEKNLLLFILIISLKRTAPIPPTTPLMTPSMSTYRNLFISDLSLKCP